MDFTKGLLFVYQPESDRGLTIILPFLYRNLVRGVGRLQRKRPHPDFGDAVESVPTEACYPPRRLGGYELGFPVVDVLVLFLGGNVVERKGGLERAGGLLNLALEVSRRGH